MEEHGTDAQPDGRSETANEKYDRNWYEILQELRVTQTGTQILTGFLLTIAFQPKFGELDGYQVTVYLTLVGIAAVTTALGLAPVSLHRILFGKGAKGRVVQIADRILRLTLVAVGITIVGVVLFIVDVTVGRTAGLVAGALALVVVITVWLLLPWGARRSR